MAIEYNSIAKYIDHTLLAPQASAAQIDELCDQARAYGFATVCVNPCRVRQASMRLQGSGVGVATVIGFPLGATSTQAKVQEALQAAADGASELDMVVNVGWIADGDWDAARRDIAAVTHCTTLPVKVILETCKLDPDQIVRATQIAAEAGAAFVKTSTGFGGGGATVEDVRRMKAHCGDMRVKASGGIRDLDTAIAMLEAGADRLGTSSGVAIATAAAARVR